MAKTSPAEFVQQVRAEFRKIVWPTRQETIRTGIMVVIMAVVLGLFFLAVDSFFDVIVKALLSLA